VLIPLCAVAWLATIDHGHRNPPAWEVLISWAIHHCPVSTNLMEMGARIGSIEMVVVLAVIGVLALKRQRRLLDMIELSVALAGAVVLNLRVKETELFQPALALWRPGLVFDFGYPSGPAMSTSALISAFVVLTWETRWRWLVISLGILYILVVGLSLIYLGISYPSEILGGWALSLAWIGTISLFRYIMSELYQRRLHEHSTH
jgi:membrane-associated phospholipid phosphatase